MFILILSTYCSLLNSIIAFFKKIHFGDLGPLISFSFRIWLYQKKWYIFPHLIKVGSCQMSYRLLHLVYFNESHLKMMISVFYLMLKAVFVLKILRFLPWLFDYVVKRLDKKAMIAFKVYDVAEWKTNNCNVHITQYLEK